MEVTKETHYFWTILDDDCGGVPIAPHIKNILHMNGLSHTLAFQDIDNAVILAAEKFAQTEMLGVLENLSRRNGSNLKETDKVHFFGQFAYDPKQFRFMIGEILLIRRLVQRVQNILNDPTKTKPFHIPNNYVISCEDTVQLAAGKYFRYRQIAQNQNEEIKSNGNVSCISNDQKQTIEIQAIEKNAVVSSNDLREINSDGVVSCLSNDQTPKRKIQDIKQNATVSSDKLRDSLYEKVNTLLNTVNVPKMRPFSAQAIKINCGSDQKHVGEVTCIFCESPKKFTVHTFRPSNSTSDYWTVSNFKKHLMKQHQITTPTDETEPHHKKLKQIKTENTSAENMKSSDNSNEEVDGSVENLDGDNNLQKFSLNEDEMKVLFDQITTQLDAVTNSLIENETTTVKMKIKIANSTQMRFIQVVKVPADGNCLFGALVHQIFHCKPSELPERSNGLRALVVSHIRKNFKQYKHSIKGRIYEERDSNDPQKILTTTEVDMMCKPFLDNYLSKPTFFGGHESLTAVSEIFKVNVLVFREKDTFSVINGFNETYQRTVCLAYRLAVNDGSKPQKVNYNHYDSVGGINKKILREVLGCSSRLS